MLNENDEMQRYQRLMELRRQDELHRIRVQAARMKLGCHYFKGLLLLALVLAFFWYGVKLLQYINFKV